jgi:flagellar hook protein FlgE
MDSFGVALSGMQAAQQMLRTAANNIANLNTPGFQAKQVHLQSAPTGGVEVSSISSSGNDDLATQLINLRQAAFLYDANAMVIRAQERMTGSLLNVLDQDRNHQSGD